MAKYYRVETYSYDLDDTIGGVTGVILAMLGKRLKVEKGTTNEEFAKRISNSTDPTVRKLYNMLAISKAGAVQPLVYEANKNNRYCLYTAEEFGQIETVLELLADIIMYDMPHLDLIYFEFDLPKEVLLYEDKHQIVISRATYDEYCPEEYFFFDTDDEDYEDFDGLDDEEFN